MATKVALVAFPSLAVAVLRTALGGLAALPLLLALRLPLGGPVATEPEVRLSVGGVTHPWQPKRAH